MRSRFWGTRDSIAKAGPSTVRHGGNTCCVELQSAAGTLAPLDCGTDAHGFGQALLASGRRSLRGHILISHTHWDHIQGIPFFAPLFERGNEWDFYAPRGGGGNLKDTLAGQMQYTYFPVSLDRLGATIRYHDLLEGVFAAGEIRVVTQYLNHTALALGYRLEADGVSVVRRAPGPLLRGPAAVCSGWQPRRDALHHRPPAAGDRSVRSPGPEGSRRPGRGAAGRQLRPLSARPRVRVVMPAPRRRG